MTAMQERDEVTAPALSPAPAAALSVGGVTYYTHWTCPAGCGYRYMTNDPHDAGDVEAASAAHVCLVGYGSPR